MKKKIYIFIFFSSLIFASSSFGAGSGSGGSTPPCGSDTWSCSDWGQCTVNGIQTRTCQKTFDCVSAETPKPDEQQNCTPSCFQDEWNCTAWEECTPFQTQRRMCTKTFECASVETPKPSESQSCTYVPQEESSESEQTGTTLQNEEEDTTQGVSNQNNSESQKRTKTQPLPTPPRVGPVENCLEDRWKCGEWSESCDTFGNHKRTCLQEYNCPYTNTPQPEAYKRCEILQCGNIENARERVLCRLNLDEAGLARELEIQYLPEECRAIINNETEKNLCIEQYRAYKPCWSIPVGERRFACARTAIGLGQSTLQVKMIECKSKNCEQLVRNSVYSMIKFRFYDLEERAEELAEEGADIRAVADFVVFISNKKIEFNNAKTKDQRRQIILDVRKGWRDFILKVKDQVE